MLQDVLLEPDELEHQGMEHCRVFVKQVHSKMIVVTAQHLERSV